MNGNINNAPAPKIHHIALKTNNFEEMQIFYKSILNFEPTLEVNDNFGFYTFDLTHHRLVIFNDESLKNNDIHTVGTHHMAYAYDSLDDLMKAYEKLENEGIKPFTVIHHGPNLAYYYTDPDNNIIELEIDVYSENQQKGLDFMKDIQNNPEKLLNNFSLMYVPINPKEFHKTWKSEQYNPNKLIKEAYAGKFKDGTENDVLPEGFNPS